MYPAVTRKSAQRSCPQCRRPLHRIARRFIDRLFHLWRPVRRYECHAAQCGWTGNLASRAWLRLTPSGRDCTGGAERLTRSA